MPTSLLRLISLTSLALSALPQGDIPLTLFLKTETNEDYIVFIKTELHEAFSDIDSEFDVLALCQAAAV